MTTILVVDDDRVGQRMLGYTLQKNGYTVVQALNGYEALERLSAQRFDLVISDLAMPEMNGRMLLQHSEADECTHELPAIMFTASRQNRAEPYRRVTIWLVARPGIPTYAPMTIPTRLARTSWG